MTDPIRFEPQGPAGWADAPDAPLETAKLISGSPLGRDHVYFNANDGKLRAGIWRSQPYTEFYESYPCDEFMHVLEGSVTLESETATQTYRKGDAFLLPRGFRGYWRQDEEMLKYYVIVG
jgi:uncharacterized protein